MNQKEYKQQEITKEITFEFGESYFSIGKFDCWIPEFGSNELEKFYIDWLFFHLSISR